MRMAEQVMSSPNTSGSQIDNCANLKTISLKPITSLPPAPGHGRPGPSAPDRRTYKRLPRIDRVQAQQEISDVRMCQDGT